MTTMSKLLLFLVIGALLQVNVFGDPSSDERDDSSKQQLYALTRTYSGKGFVADDESFPKESDIWFFGKDDASVHFIYCKRCMIDQAFIDKIADFKNLEVIEFKNYSYASEIVFTFDKISKLKSLRFSYQHKDELPADLCNHLHNCKNLEYLEFDYDPPKETPSGIDVWDIQYRLLPQQIFKDISKTSISALDIIVDEERLRLLGTRMKVISLDLTGSSLTLPIAELLHNFSRIEELILDGMWEKYDTGETVTDSFIEKICDIPLKRLWIPGNYLTDKSVPVLLNWTSLEKCTCVGFKITKEGYLQLSRKFNICEWW